VPSKPGRHQSVIMDEDTLERLNEWRKRKGDFPPSKSSAILDLVQIALDAEGIAKKPRTLRAKKS
jgi:hypothetical protein